MLEQIKGEFSDSMYVVISVNDVCYFSQLSTVVYHVIKCGEVCGRFINFIDVSNNKSAAAIDDLFIKQLRELWGLNKLL